MATMVVIMNKDFDGYKLGEKYSIEISLARRYVKANIAVPLSVHLDKMAELKRMKELAKADEAKKKALLKAKEKQAKETADSKPATKRSKAVKK